MNTERNEGPVRRNSSGRGGRLDADCSSALLCLRWNWSQAARLSHGTKQQAVLLFPLFDDDAFLWSSAWCEHETRCRSVDTTCLYSLLGVLRAMCVERRAIKQKTAGSDTEARSFVRRRTMKLKSRRRRSVVSVDLPYM